MNIMTIDIEEWWVYANQKNKLPKSDEYRLNELLEVVLSKFAEKGIRATFFCVGMVALKYPNVINKIYQAGHEIGCHSNTHEYLQKKTRKFFHEDTFRAIQTLENLISDKIRSYRAPAFSIGPSNLHFMEVLLENGIEIDSSIFPGYRSFGGYPGSEIKYPCRLDLDSGHLKEFPITTKKIFRSDLATCGGGYFRMLPYNLIKKSFHENNYNMAYFHLADFDIHQTRNLSNVSDLGENKYVRYFKSYYGLKNSLSKFNRLLDDDISFISLSQAKNSIDWDAVKSLNLATISS